VEEIQRRRDFSASRQRSRSAPKLTSRSDAGMLVRVTTWTLVGAVSFVAYALLRGGGRLDWPSSSSWLWWLWASPTQGLDT